mmetsp:Transcript_111821/g.340042  ORF Transcript_111821/g.340042 Transcript_111821/m.340042 type:complete len:447 (-) Transcript_111821:40-1380(-)
MAKVSERLLVDGDPCKVAMEKLTEQIESQLRKRAAAAREREAHPEPPAHWQVSFAGAAKVRKAKTLHSEILGRKWKCSTIFGQREGGWVKLLHEEGYVKIRYGSMVLLRQLPTYKRISEGTCAEHGGFPITEADACEAAAEALGLGNVKSRPTSYAPSPEGCYLSAGGALWLSDAESNRGHGAMDVREPLCAIHAEVPEPCQPITTTNTTTTTTRPTRPTPPAAWGHPSLFCFSLLRAGGLDMGLVRLQHARNASVFGCDEFSLLSSGGAVRLAPDYLVAGLPGQEARDSLGASDFLAAWQMVAKDGRYKRHDWTVKVEPDAVFFPERLRAILRSYADREDSGLFLLNCNRPLKLYGPIEVYSRRAVDAYVDNQALCKRELPWKEWGEALFMEKCMQRLDMDAVFDEGVLADVRCHNSPCYNESKAAFYSYYTASSYLRCWDSSPP